MKYPPATRTQDKIINGYAAMLRTHNPILSSKVFLDEKGRLKVVKAHKATRRREHGRRRRKRRNRGCRDHESDNTLAGGTVSGSRPWVSMSSLPVTYVSATGGVDSVGFVAQTCCLLWRREQNGLLLWQTKLHTCI